MTAMEVVVAQPVWRGCGRREADHYCMVIDGDGRQLLSRRVVNDEAALLELIAAVTTLADGGEITWAIDLNAGGAALLITLLDRRPTAAALHARPHGLSRLGQLPRRRQDRRQRRRCDR